MWGGQPRGCRGARGVVSVAGALSASQPGVGVALSQACAVPRGVQQGQHSSVWADADHPAERGL
eukprot:9501186-Lingulodinium_polyedra.AAC.1